MVRLWRPVGEERGGGLEGGFWRGEGGRGWKQRVGVSVCVCLSLSLRVSNSREREGGREGGREGAMTKRIGNRAFEIKSGRD